jgi:predicted NUDIX family NTP pyrophosphohydrolase
MAKQSAGLIMYRLREQGIEVLLVHPGGPFWTRRDLGAWTIPKGLTEPGEDDFSAAKREFMEETGLSPIAPFLELPEVKQSSKRVKAWAFEGNCDPTQVKSNMFQLEWPPRSGKIQEFPEVDRAAWFTLEEAKRHIIKAQLPLLTALEKELERSSQEHASPDLSESL